MKIGIDIYFQHNILKLQEEKLNIQNKNFFAKFRMGVTGAGLVSGVDEKAGGTSLSSGPYESIPRSRQIKDAQWSQQFQGSFQAG